MHGISTWADKHNYQDPIHYIFAHGDGEGNRLDGLFRYMARSDDLRRKYRLQGTYSRLYAQELMKPEPAIQAADMIAYETNKHLLQWLELDCPSYMPPENSRPYLNYLGNLDNHGFVYRDMELILQFKDMTEDICTL